MSSAFGTITSGLEFHTIIACTGGSELGEQHLAEPAHVEPARVAIAEQIGPVERVLVEELALPHADAAREPAAAIGPGADEGRQAGERAEEHRPVLVVLAADQRADRGRADRAVVARQRLDVGGVEAGRRRRPFGSPVGDGLGELVEAESCGRRPTRRRRDRRG